MSKKQFYGITYPFTTEDLERYYIDLNNNVDDKIKSLLMHLIFTPKGQKIRDPEFGTDLIRFIFEPNDIMSLDGIKSEISESVKKYINGIEINDIKILESDDDKSEIFVRIDYTVFDGINRKNDSLITKI